MCPERSEYQVRVLVTARCELATRATMLSTVFRYCKLGYLTVVEFCSARRGRRPQKKKEEYESLSTEVFLSAVIACRSYGVMATFYSFSY